MLHNIAVFLDYLHEKGITSTQLNPERSYFIKIFTNNVLLKNNVNEESLHQSFSELFIRCETNNLHFNCDEDIISQIKRFSHWVEKLKIEQHLLNQKKFLRNNIILSALSAKTTEDMFFEKLMRHLKDLAFMENDTHIYIRGLSYFKDREANMAFRSLIHKSGMSKNAIFWKNMIEDILVHDVVKLDAESFYETGAWNILVNNKNLSKNVVASYLKNEDYSKSIKKALEMLSICTNKESAFLLVKELASYCDNIGEIIIRYRGGNMTFKESVISRADSVPEFFDFFIDSERKMLNKEISKKIDNVPPVRI